MCLEVSVHIEYYISYYPLPIVTILDMLFFPLHIIFNFFFIYFFFISLNQKGSKNAEPKHKSRPRSGTKIGISDAGTPRPDRDLNVETVLVKL